MKTPHIFVLFILTLILTTSTVYSGTRLANSQAPSPASEANFSDRLTGDWGGLRTKMLDRGVDWTFTYTGETFGNLSGGALGRQGFIFGGLWEMGLDLDLERLMNWKGASFHVNSFYAHGASLTQKYTGDLLTVSNIDDYDSLSLFELWFQQNFFDDKLSFRIGQLAADEEFATSDYSSLFLNGTFGWPSVISANALETPAYGMAGLGLRIKVEPTDWFFTQAGIFDGRIDSVDQDGKSLNDSNTRWSFNKGDGIFVIGELGFKIGHGEESKALPGTYKLGAWVHTAKHDDLRFDDAGFSLADDGTITGNPVTGIPARHRNNTGFYLVFDQMLYRVSGTEDNGLGFFFRAGMATEKISPISHYFDTGFNYKGLIKGRPNDIIGIGFAFANISNRIKDLEKDDLEINQPEDLRRSSHEAVLELTYMAQITPWFTLQPDFQYVINPGALKQNDDAVVIGLRGVINF